MQPLKPEKIEEEFVQVAIVSHAPAHERIASRHVRYGSTTIRDLLRHQSIETRMRYADLSPGHRKSAVDALEKSLTRLEDESEKTG